MYPQNPQINPYDPKTLDALGEAFDATWVVLQARDPFRDFERAYELRTALSQKLMTLAADGVTDPIELREWALESLPLLTQSRLLGIEGPKPARPSVGSSTAQSLRESEHVARLLWLRVRLRWGVPGLWPPPMPPPK